MPNWLKVVVELEVIEVVKVEVAKVEALVAEPLAVDLSMKVQCVRWRPTEVETGNVGSCRRRSHCGDPVAVPVPLVVEVQKQVGVLNDDVDQVHRTWDPDVGMQIQVGAEWKIGIQVVRDLDEVAEEVDALEVHQEIVGLTESTRKSVVMSAIG